MANNFNLQTITITPSKEEDLVITPEEGYDGFSSVRIEGVTSDIDLNIKPENIKKYTKILNITGTLIGEENKLQKTTRIGPNFLRNKGNYLIESIELPNTITSIGYRAFQGCTNLKQIIIPNSVISIGKEAFSSCSSLNEVILLEGLKNIGTRAFYSCHFYKINLPKSLEYIDTEAFYSSYLTEIEIPPLITTIKSATFCRCPYLKKIFIPLSVTLIETTAFNLASKLTDVYYEGTQEQWNNIRIATYNTPITNATKHFNCTGLPEE